MLYQNPEFIGQDWWKWFIGQGSIRLIVLDVAPDCARRRILSKLRKGPINRELCAEPLSGEAWKRAQDAYAAIIAEIRVQKPDAIFIDGSNQSLAQSANALARNILSGKPYR
ncbi:hypothetical protein [Terrihabitans soli]|nr:hypothetical protein [Terrihabitans soli]